MKISLSTFPIPTALKTSSFRQAWFAYFTEQKMRVIFYSAIDELEKVQTIYYLEFGGFRGPIEINKQDSDCFVLES